MHTLYRSSSGQAKPTSFNINTSLPVYCAAFKPKMTASTQENAGGPARAQNLGIFTSSSRSDPLLGGLFLSSLSYVSLTPLPVRRHGEGNDASESVVSPVVAPYF